MSRAATAATPEQIDAAIEKGKAYVFSQQLPAGRWEKDAQRVGTDHASWVGRQGDTWGGYTALSTYALLAAGESPSNPKIKAAVEFLKRADIVGVYAIAMRLQVWLLIPHDTAEMKALIRKDANFLMNNVNNSKNDVYGNNGLWDYLGKGERADHSVSQYGVLGLWAAQQSGAVDVGNARWKVYEDAWRRDQKETGGWSYEKDGPEIPSMTAAGVATLFITSDYLHAEEGVACVGSLRNPWIEKGLAWIDTNYSSLQGSSDNYAMYGIERIGTASGYKFFASHDWFADLAEMLVTNQTADGLWSSNYPGASPLDATCFALLFLSRGRAPVTMNKLDYRSGGGPATNPAAIATRPSLANWNERPRDLANLSAWIGRETETYRNWQIVNFHVPANQLHDAPMLYMSGNQAFSLHPADAAVLKLFVEQGGMLLANADCGRDAFSQSFRDLGKTLFGGTFRELPPEHPAFTHQQFPARQWRTLPKVEGLSNGIRELMILIPTEDPARWWQNPTGAVGHEDAYELGIDLYQYSIDRQIWSKGTTYLVWPNPKILATRKIKLARLQVGQNWNPEPGGWPRMAGILHNQDLADLSVFNATPGQGALTAAHLAHLTGTTDFTLTPAARAELQNFIKQGGTLIVDAAGGSQAFADAAQRELQATFGSYAAGGLDTPLPATDPLYNLPTHKITNFTYRPWARLHGIGGLKSPRIRVMQIAGRPAIFFSREDLSSGIVGEPVDGIMGYSPETATEIMRNIILFSTQARTHPAPPPAH
jgi:hypothetical protein